MTAAYYNEHDPYAAQWLRNLISANLIAPGVVDERDIRDVTPNELASYTQCHFFAGIGGWSRALRLASVPDHFKVWTGSCPCQPFSQAGKARGFADERHLWPDWFHLIRVCRPAIVLGEQVASPDGLRWLDLVSSDLEGTRYTIGAADLCAAGVGAPHIRQRLWWVAHAEGAGSSSGGKERGGISAILGGIDRTSDVGLAHADAPGRSIFGSGRIFDRERPAQRHDVDGCGEFRGMGDTEGDAQRQSWIAEASGGWSSASRGSGAWGAVDWLPCLDGKARPTKPGLFPLAHGIPARVGRLRAYGNAIVPQVAAEFIKAALSDQGSPDV